MSPTAKAGAGPSIPCTLAGGHHVKLRPPAHQAALFTPQWPQLPAFLFSVSVTQSENTEWTLQDSAVPRFSVAPCSKWSDKVPCCPPVILPVAAQVVTWSGHLLVSRSFVFHLEMVQEGRGRDAGHSELPSRCSASSEQGGKGRCSVLLREGSTHTWLSLQCATELFL